MRFTRVVQAVRLRFTPIAGTLVANPPLLLAECSVMESRLW